MSFAAAAAVPPLLTKYLFFKKKFAHPKTPEIDALDLNDQLLGLGIFFKIVLFNAVPSTLIFEKIFTFQKRHQWTPWTSMTRFWALDFFSKFSLFQFSTGTRPINHGQTVFNGQVMVIMVVTTLIGMLLFYHITILARLAFRLQIMPQLCMK